MTEHTKEPWKTGSSPAGKSVVFLVGDEPEHTLGPDENWIDCNTEANARRIVACVNACEGLDTEELEQFGLGTAFGTALFDVTAQRLKASLDKVVGNAFEIEQQRDQLLAALEALLAEHAIPSSGCKDRMAYEQAMASIAAVKGD